VGEEGGGAGRAKLTTNGRVNRLQTSISKCASFPTASGVRVFISPKSYANTTATMDVFKAVETYITKMVSEPSAMKVLLLDAHTVCGDMPLISLRKN